MAYLIDPRCSIPTFLMDNEEVAAHCGRISGYVTAFILSLILIIFGAIIYFSYVHQSTHFWKFFFFSTIVVLFIVIWWGIPPWQSWLKKRHWQGYQEQIKSYQSAGITKDEAIKKLQDIYQVNIQADAINNAGSKIADAMYYNTFQAIAKGGANYFRRN